MKRRTFLAGGLMLPALTANFTHAEPTFVGIPSPNRPDDQAFLDDLKKRCYRYFLEASHPVTGLVPDRAATDGSWLSPHASSAACGFALASHSVAAKAGWAPRGETADRVRLLLRSLVQLAEHERGFVYHFFSTADGRRMHQCEASSIDTALMLAGSVCAASTFSEDTEIVELADVLYRRVDWQWMLGDNDCLHMGWTPETGMLSSQWDTYSELILLVLMGIGAPQSPIPPRCWNAWRREPVLQHEGESFLGYPPLFVHQYPMAFFDFRNRRSPSGRSYWQNAIRAHRAQIGFMDSLSTAYPREFGHYGQDLWGLTSSDSQQGYRDWGGPYDHGRIEPDRGIDGTVVPSASAGGLAILPKEALHTLRFQRERYGEQIYSRYGFVNAYNPISNWVGTDVIGIDTGITLLMAENLQSEGVWDAFMSHPTSTRALQLAGFRQC